MDKQKKTLVSQLKATVGKVKSYIAGQDKPKSPKAVKAKAKANPHNAKAAADLIKARKQKQQEALKYN